LPVSRGDRRGAAKKRGKLLVMADSPGRLEVAALVTSFVTCALQSFFKLHRDKFSQFFRIAEPATRNAQHSTE
jgi:hypothetical protein